MFEWSETEGRHVAMHHPFTAPRDEDRDRLDTDLGAVLAKAYDLVLNGSEIGGGSIRIHEQPLQRRIFELLKISEQDARSRSGSSSRRSSTARRRTAGSRSVWTGSWRCWLERRRSGTSSRFRRHPPRRI